jgi:hypothetical protein
MNPNVKTLEQYSPIRQQQLAEYHAEQARMEELKRVPTAPITVVPVNTQIATIRKLLNECTALNVASLNLGGGQAQTSVDNNLDYKLNELYQLIKDVREVKKFSGKLIS